MNEGNFDNIDFDSVEEVSIEGRKFPLLNPQSWFAGRVIEADVSPPTKKGSRSLQLTLAPMDVEGEPRRPTCRYNLWLPRNKTDENGNPVPWKGFRFLHQFAAAIAGRAEFPYTIREYKGELKDPDGNVLTEDEAKAYNKDLQGRVHEFVKGYVGNPEGLVGKEVYFKTTVAEQREGKTYVNVDRLRHIDELSDDIEVLTDPDNWSFVPSNS